MHLIIGGGKVKPVVWRLATYVRLSPKEREKKLFHLCHTLNLLDLPPCKGVYQPAIYMSADMDKGQLRRLSDNPEFCSAQ